MLIETFRGSSQPFLASVRLRPLPTVSFQNIPFITINICYLFEITFSYTAEKETLNEPSNKHVPVSVFGIKRLRKIFVQ
jgi:hypothetical protein